MALLIAAPGASVQYSEVFILPSPGADEPLDFSVTVVWIKTVTLKKKKKKIRTRKGRGD